MSLKRFVYTRMNQFIIYILALKNEQTYGKNMNIL